MSILSEFPRWRLTIILTIILIGCALLPLAAQRQAEVWHFGFHAGIDFRQEPPLAITDSRIDVLEGCAAYADPQTGALLFYTDGFRVWRRDNSLMTSSSSWLPADQQSWPLSSSTTQSALVLPHPGAADLYYVFNPGNVSNVPRPDEWNAERLFDELSYTLIDMSKQNGLGEIVEHNALTPTVPMSEKLSGTVACSGEELRYWVLTQDGIFGSFYAFRVDNAGVAAAPVISPVDQLQMQLNWAVGQLKISPDGGSIASVFQSPDNSNLLLCRFDKLSGRVSDQIAIKVPTSNGVIYGLSFSPDNSRLYVASSRGDLYQLSLADYRKSAIEASAVRLAVLNTTGIGQLQIGPDRRIYFARIDATRLGVINFPNRAGRACEPAVHRLDLNEEPGDSRRVKLGLPNFMDHIFDESGASCLSPQADFEVDAICEGEAATFRDRSRNTPAEWRWRFEGGEPVEWEGRTPPPVRFAAAGEYQVTLEVRNSQGSDRMTQTISVLPRPALAVRAPRICEGETAQLEATGALRYEWSPSEGLSDPLSSSPTADLSETTLFTVQGWNAAGCVSSATLRVEVRPWGIAALSLPDTAVTPGEEILLPLELNVPEDYLPLQIERLCFDLRYDGRLVTLRGVEDAALLNRRLDGEEEVLSLERRDISVQEARSTVLGLRVLGLISLATSSELGIENLELVFAPGTCLTVERRNGRFGIHDFCLGYGIRFATRLQMQVAPNPARDRVDVQIRPADNGAVRLRIVNSFGRSVQEFTKSAVEGQTQLLNLAVSGLPAGLYYLLAENGGQVRREKLLLR